MSAWDPFYGSNAGYLLDLYDRYCEDPSSVDPASRAFFQNWRPPDDPAAPPAASEGRVGAAPPPVGQELIGKITGAVNLAQSIRAFGHLPAQLDPLGTPPPQDPALDPAFHGITDEDLARLPASLIGGPAAEGKPNALEAIRALREIYSAFTGHDFDHVTDPEERDWLREAVESRRFRPPARPIEEVELLERLTQVEVFERFLHRAFPGKFRFSIEGLDVMVPMLDEALHAVAADGVRHVLIGMPHRGRLNVLAHILRKPYDQILAEFKDPINRLDVAAQNDLGWTGDVKYHRGTQWQMEEGGGTSTINVRLAPNPSHLEFINPVVMGMARALGTSADRPGTSAHDPLLAMAVMIHGDAAFPGQGIVAETLNLSRLAGYTTGGTLHIIANNQLGFTTDPDHARSTMYASDLAKGFEIPIIHVNADCPEDCIEVVRLACAWRRRFGKDFLIDLVGYRRWGHNEADEPMFTQPMMYRLVNEHPTVRQIWAERLAGAGRIAPELPEQLERKYYDLLQGKFNELDPEEMIRSPHPKPPPPGAARRVRTAAPAERLLALNESLARLPEGFEINGKLEKILARRREAIAGGGERAVDWTSAEELALASILEDGLPVRLTGQDVERGTFSHRHAVYRDQRTGERFCPLQNLPQARASFDIRNSSLSEAGALGFEFGYNLQQGRGLVIWEAQYGDFINGAQVLIDEFLVSARAKWGQTPSLVMLLPHGYEGAGPDHSSGRLERFLSLAADINIRVANCTTAAQYFHLLRRQALLLETDPLPLVIMSPKSLLRNPLIARPLSELSEGHWQPVIDDAQADPQRVRRLILCSGKVWVDLTAGEEPWPAELAAARLEQLYPFPKEDVAALLERYPQLEELVWLQEEPMNMGPWGFVGPLLREVAGELPLHYLGRPRYSSPAEGSAAWHAFNQKKLVEKARLIEPAPEPAARRRAARKG